jgi:hypothetical protein
MDEQQLMAILAALAGTAPNEGFEVQAPQRERGMQPTGDLGMSPVSVMMGDRLNQLQGAGVAPPMPAETGGGPETQELLLSILELIKQQRLGEMQQQEGDPASLGSQNNRELLKALLSGS